MNKHYIIQWRSKVNGRAGRGTKQFDKDEAERLVAELNREYPDILHEMSEFHADHEHAEQRQPALSAA